MKNNLIELDHFGIFTFNTTSHALKAEKVLQARQADFIVIPTLREISASCGLSVKFELENGSQYYEHLLENQVQIDGIYQVEKVGKGYQIKKLDAI